MKRTYIGIFMIMIAMAPGIATEAFAQAPGNPPVNLGSAGNFSVLAGSTVTNTGPTAVTGTVGVSSGTAITGFPPGTATGGFQAGPGSTAAAGQVDLTTAFNDAAGRPCTTVLTGQNLGSLPAPLTPGVYCFAADAFLTGTLTLDFLGNPNSIFIFKIGTALTTASASQILLVNTGGSACPQNNVFFQVGSSADLGTGSSFQGNILADQRITLFTGARLIGRALARIAAVNLDTNVISPCLAALAPCPVITVNNPATFPGGTVGTAFPATTFTATGGSGTYTFTVTNGALPTGLVLNPVSGVVSGTPTTAGSFTFTITATDTATGCLGSRPFNNVVIAPAAAVPPIPTLGEVGVWVLMALLGGFGLFASKKL